MTEQGFRTPSQDNAANFSLTARFLRFTKRLSAGLAAFALLGTISDLLQPYAPFVWILFGLSTTAALGIWLAIRRAPDLRPSLLNAVFVFAILGAGALGLGVTQLSLPGGTKVGAFAGKFKNVRDAQGALLGIEQRLQTVETGVTRIEGTTKNIDTTTRTIDQRTQNIEQQLTVVKRETSADPRKELANRGIAWTPAAFSAAYKQQDVEILKLFLAGGFDWALAWQNANGNEYMRAQLPLMRDDIFQVFLGQKDKYRLVACDLPAAETLDKYPHATWHSTVYYEGLLAIAKRTGRKTIAELCGDQFKLKVEAHRAYWTAWLAKQTKCRRERGTLCDGYQDVYKSVEATGKVQRLLEDFGRFLG